jgi:hypothetical protein
MLGGTTFLVVHAESAGGSLKGEHKTNRGRKAMKFRVEFTTGMNNKTGPFDHFNPGHGLDFVSEIRELAGLPDLPLNRIRVNDTCSTLTRKSTYEIKTDNETHINSISSFDVAQEAQVIVPSGFLGQYVRMTAVITRMDPDDAGNQADDAFDKKYPRPARQFIPIRRIIWALAKEFVVLRARRKCKKQKPHERDIAQLTNGWEVDNTLLYNDWVEAGFPEFWGISEATFNKSKAERADIVKQFKEAKEKDSRKEHKETVKKQKDSLNDLAEDILKLGNRLKKITER